MSILESYRNTYQPLVDGFCRSIDLAKDDLSSMAAPFLPYFGAGYESSVSRVLFIGIDTKYWGEKDAPGVTGFVESQNASPGHWLRILERLQRDMPFTEWGARRSTFFGFVMSFLSDVYGATDWGVMKRGGHRDLLASFAWANEHVIENYASTAQASGVSKTSWEHARNASLPLTGARSLITALKPRVIIVLNKSMNVERYFSGIQIEKVETTGRQEHWYARNENIHILRVPHPNNMRYSGIEPEVRAWLKKALQNTGLSLVPNSFIRIGDESAFLKSLISHAKPGISKYEVIAWIASELSKSDSLMSVPALVGILNELNIQTNYGTKFVGERGSYRLVKTAYDRFMKSGNQVTAGQVARAFVKPNGHYAYI